MRYIASVVPHHDGGDGYTVTFVDFPDIRVLGKTLDQALFQAGKDLYAAVCEFGADKAPTPSTMDVAMAHLEERKAGYQMHREAFCDYVEVLTPSPPK